MKYYETLSEAVNDLVKRGYVSNFNLKNESVTCVENEISLHPEDFEIDEVHRFEGNTDPGDENVLYAISSGKHNIKGLLVNAYGMYSDSFSGVLISKIK